MTLFFRRPLLLILLVSITVYSVALLYFFVSVSNSSTSLARTFPVVGSDSEEYSILARNIFENKAFSLSQEKIFKPNTFRTPGYPFFVAVLYTINHSFYTVIFAQIALVFFSSSLIFLIARKYIGESWAMVPALLFAVDPTTILSGVLILSDVLFVFILLLVVYLILIVKPSVYTYILIGILVGLSAYIRPIGMYLLIIFLPLSIYVQKISIKKCFYFSAVSVACFFLVIAPWFIRNHRITNVWGFSSISAYNVFYYNIPMYVSYMTNFSETEVRRALYKEINLTREESENLLNVPRLMTFNKSFLKDNLFYYTFFHITKSVNFFYTSGAKTWAVLMRDIAGYDRAVLKWPFLIESGIWTLIALLSVTSLFFKKNRHLVLVCAFLVFYFFILTGPVAYSRYRMPAAPFMFIMACIGLKEINMIYTNKYHVAK